jgi:hypothetical protein
LESLLALYPDSQVPPCPHYFLTLLKLKLMVTHRLCMHENNAYL